MSFILRLSQALSIVLSRVVEIPSIDLRLVPGEKNLKRPDEASSDVKEIRLTYIHHICLIARGANNSEFRCSALYQFHIPFYC